MLLRHVLTLLEDLFVYSAAKVGPMFTKKSLNDSEISLSSETISSLSKKPKSRVLPTFSPDFTYNRQIWSF